MIINLPPIIIFPVFHAIYLETLTRKEVIEKISSLFSIQQTQITESCIQQKQTGFLVLLTDDVRTFINIYYCLLLKTYLFIVDIFVLQSSILMYMIILITHTGDSEYERRVPVLS